MNELDNFDAPLRSAFVGKSNGVRIVNCLEYSNIRTLRDLANTPDYELRKIRNFGITCLKTVRSVVPYSQPESLEMMLRRIIREEIARLSTAAERGAGG